MRHRFFMFMVVVLAALVLNGVLHPQPAAAGNPSLAVTYKVGFKYFSKYKGRLVNAEVAFKQLQKFLDTVEWNPKRQYSFNRDVLHNNLRESDGYVNTPLGYAFGACGAPSLLNKMVKTATFWDADGKEKPVFQTVMVWTWRGDKTYEQYGATIFLDPGGPHNRDYVWKLNPEYNGAAPKLKINFDPKAETVDMTMEYSNEIEPPAGAASTLEANVKVPIVATASATEDASATEVAEVNDYSLDTAATLEVSGPVEPSPTKIKPTTTTAPTLVPTKVATKVPTATPTPEPKAVAASSIVDISLPLTVAQKTLALTDFLKGLIKGSRFGVSIVPIGDANQILEEVGVNEKMQTYVASAFKGPLAIYFFENIDPDVWNTVPVVDWTAKSESEVGEQYRAKWNKYHNILYNLWTAAVWSENDSTGNILQYVYEHSKMPNKGANAIIAFNNWAHSIGVSEVAGLRSWFNGATNCADCIDTRYGTQPFTYRTKIFVPNNNYSPRDLAQVYVHLAKAGPSKGYYEVATELLGTMRGPNAPSMIQWFFRKVGIQTASKDGFVGPDDQDSDGYYISTDAGLLTLPDGKQFAVAYMAFDAGNLLDDAIVATANVLVPTPANAKGTAKNTP
jgi:hypothetical protein